MGNDFVVLLDIEQRVLADCFYGIERVEIQPIVLEHTPPGFDHAVSVCVDGLLTEDVSNDVCESDAATLTPMHVLCQVSVLGPTNATLVHAGTLCLWPSRVLRLLHRV